MPSTEGLFLRVQVTQQPDGQWLAKVGADGVGEAEGYGETSEAAHTAALAAFEALPTREGEGFDLTSIVDALAAPEGP